MNEILELTPDLVEDERRSDDGRRVVEDRRVGVIASQSWPKDKERRSGNDRRAIDRRKKCMHCGQSYIHHAIGQPRCGCHLNAFQNPGGG